MRTLRPLLAFALLASCSNDDAPMNPGMGLSAGATGSATGEATGLSAGNGGGDAQADTGRQLTMGEPGSSSVSHDNDSTSDSASSASSTGMTEAGTTAQGSSSGSADETGSTEGGEETGIIPPPSTCGNGFCEMPWECIHSTFCSDDCCPDGICIC